MKFEINGSQWEIIEKDNDEMIILNDCENGKLNGLTEYSTHTIYINKDIIDIELTLYHELTHCFMYVYGHNQFQDKTFTYEDVCEICACSHNLIHNIVKDYLKIRDEKRRKREVMK